MFPMPSPLLTVGGASAPAGKSFSFNGTSDYMELASTIGSAYPFTFMAWFNASALGAQRALMAVGGTTSRATLDCDTPNVMRACVYNSTGTIRNSDAPASFGTGAWHLMIGVFDNATSRTAWQDGSAGTTNTTSVTPSSVAKTNIGTRYSSGTRGNFFAGNIAHVAIWNIALSGTDIASLAAHALPSAVQSGNLVFYADLQNGIARDSITATNLTLSGAVSSTNGPF